MKAVKLCVSDPGILYVDQSLQCWLFQKQDNELLSLVTADPLTFYMANGFGNVKGEQLIRLAIFGLAELEGFIKKDYEYYSYEPPCIIEDVKPGILYSDTDTRWYDQLIFRPILTKNKTRSNDLFVFKDIFHSVDDDIISICGDEDLDFDLADWRPLSNEEIDNLKSDVTDPDWYLKPFDPILCHTHEQYPNTMDFIDSYSAEDELFKVHQEENEIFKSWTEYAKPVSNEFLDSFKT